MPNRQDGKFDQAGILQLLAEPLPVEGKTRTVFDSELRSFAVRISPAGRATFCMVYSHGGRIQRYTFGHFRTEDEARKSKDQRDAKALTAKAARAEAVKLRTRIEAGENIAATKRANEEASKSADEARLAERKARLTVAQAFQNYRADLEQRARPLRPSTLVSIDKAFRLHILPHLGGIEIRELTADQVSAMHRAVGKGSKAGRKRTGGPIAANRATDYLSGLLSWAGKRIALQGNAARRNKDERFHEEGRERFLDDKEWHLLEAELDARPYLQSVPVGPRVEGRAMEQRKLKAPQLAVYLSCEAIRMFLLTGCRKGEALGARWDQVDLKAGVWTKPSSSTKQKRVHNLPLNPRMVAKLREIRAAHADPVFVFPGKERLAALEAGRIPRTGSHLADVSGIWRPMRKRLGLGDVRLHDLRHSHASKLLDSGVDLYTASKALGHSTIKTTEKYAHLSDQKLRAAVNLVGEFSARVAKQPAPAAPAKRPKARAVTRARA